MSRPLPPLYDYELTVVSVTDGDTIRAHLVRVEEHDGTDEFTETLIRRTRDTRGTPIRFLWVNTPERKDDPDGWRAATTDTTRWLAYPGGELRCETHGRESRGGRLLGDIYYLDADDVRHSLSEWLIRDRGWPVYEGD